MARDDIFRYKELTSWNQVEILREVSNDENLILNDQLARNIEIVLKFFVHKKYALVRLKKSETELDRVCFHILSKFMHLHFFELKKFIEIVFIDFNDEDLYSILGPRNYQIYCNDHNKKPKWDKKFLENEMRKLEMNSNFEKYNEFSLIKSYFREIPFSYFLFPKEKGKDRFVYFFNVYSHGSKKEVLELIQLLGVHKMIFKIISENEINSIVSSHALGFSYADEKLMRVTFYTNFSNTKDVKQIKNYIEKYHNFRFRIGVENIWTYAVDFYENNSEIKIYEESHKFEEELHDKEIEGILRGKPCTRVFKFFEGKLKSTKYEFQLRKNFTDYERVILKSNSDVLSIYLLDGRIVHKVEY